MARELKAHYKSLGLALEGAYLTAGPDGFNQAFDRTFQTFASPMNTLILDNNTITAGFLGDYQMDILADKGLRMPMQEKQNARLIINQMHDFLVMNAQRSTALTSDTDRKNASKIVERGLKRGSSTENIARSLRRKFGSGLGRARAAVIARTEVGIAGSRAEFQGAKNQKAKRKEWITVTDGLQREHHDDVDGETITIGRFFRPDGEKMAHPHDVEHGASASNLVNCRCGMRYIK
jgi:hypothetical protein